MEPTRLEKIESELKKLKNKVNCSTQFFDNFSEFPPVGSSCVLYVDRETGAIYIWDGDSYITVLSENIPRHGSFYDTTDQSVTSGQVAPMEYNTTDFSSGISVINDLSSNPSIIKIAFDGKYNIQFSAQLYRENGGNAAEVVIWLRKNGTNVPDTSTIVHFANNTVYSVAAWNFFVDANAGDEFQIMWTQNDGIILLHDSENLVVPYPAIPSVILTVSKV